MERRGFSRVELVVLLIVAVFLLGGALVIVRAIQRSRWGAVNLEDSSRQRGLAVALEQWMQASGDRWPLAHADSGWNRNTSADLYGGMLLQQLVTADHLIAPGPWEPNPRIRPLRQGETFSVDVAGKRPAHASYAHLQPTEARLAFFTSRSPTLGVFSSRFPEVAGVTQRDRWGVTTPLVNPRSYAMRKWKLRDQWMGNMTFADGHVEFIDGWLERGVTPAERLSTYTNGNGDELPDLPFFDEPDDPTGTNRFLGIFTKAGRERGDFKAVYD